MRPQIAGSHWAGATMRSLLAITHQRRQRGQQEGKLMTDMVTIRGFASADVVLRSTKNGVPMATLRIGSTERRHDKLTNEWVDGTTNWFTVTMFRALAQNAAFSVRKGDRIIVIGKLRINTWLREDGRTGTSVDIEAEALGSDLVFGTCTYRRNAAQRQEPAMAAMGDVESYGHSTAANGSGTDPGDRDDNDLPDSDEGGAEGADDGDDVAATEDGESVDMKTGELADVPY